MLKRKPYRNKKITESARGESCTLNFSGCRNERDTVVWCHSPFEMEGMAVKADDYTGCYGCAHCHDILDGRVRSSAHMDEMNRYWHFHQAMKRSLRKLFDKGVIK